MRGRDARELAGPYAPDPQGIARFGHGFRVERTWKRDDLRVAALVQAERSGEALQALAMTGCAMP